MFSKYHNRKGFILIKLIIIVVIIGLNPGCTENRYIQTTIEAEPSDVVGTLRLIYSLEEIYYQRNGDYLPVPNNDSFSNLGMKIHDDDIYNYVVEVVKTKGIIVTATANIDDDTTLDTWEMKYHNGDITNTINDLVE